MNPFRALSTTERTTLHRLRERGATDRSALDDVLNAGLICHFGVVIDGSPVVLPTGYGWIGDTLYLHGSSANRSFQSADGQEICVTITLLDGLVCARSVFNNSMNYRSAVIFGTARLVTDAGERLAAIRAITEHLIPGRWDNSRGPSKKELAATSVIALSLGEASVKIRSGEAKDEDEDYDLDYWAGVLPITQTIGAAEPDPRLREGIEVPAHIAALEQRLLEARAAVPDSD
ncbi:MAG TPA: pyridoxamine 5'-phosphate oxidase family protein [Streptosporangiaceae bacterium]|nr:pyridoxamine 5'-phosphate oxidase family protein [Streptosporangiaceae bacterium]